MTDDKEQIFWNTLEILNNLELLPYVVVMGSWAEYLYSELLGTNYNPIIQTRDVDFMYQNIRKPANSVPLISTMKEAGYIYTEDPVTGTGKFFKGESMEIEFLTKLLGSGENTHTKIEPLGIITDSLRDINILDGNTIKISKNGLDINVPDPATYIMQKILINNHRVPVYKREKDIQAVDRILPYVKENLIYKKKFIDLYNNLSKNQRKEFWNVVNKRNIDLYEFNLLGTNQVQTNTQDTKIPVSFNDNLSVSNNINGFDDFDDPGDIGDDQEDISLTLRKRDHYRFVVVSFL